MQINLRRLPQVCPKLAVAYRMFEADGTDQDTAVVIVLATYTYIA